MSKELTQQRLQEILDYDPETGVFTRKVSSGGKKAGSIAGSPNVRGYWTVGVDGKYYKAHRLAWLYVHGEWPEGVIDHIDRDTANNAVSNLRDVTQVENSLNVKVRERSKTGVNGVRHHHDGRRFRATFRGRHLGLFEKFNDAVAARRAAEVAA